MLILVVFQAFNMAAYAGSRFLVAVYAVHLGGSPLVIGVLMALFAAAPTVLTVPTGKLIDRIGTRVPLLVSHLLLFAMIILPSIWPGTMLLYVVAPVVGVAFFATYLASSTLSSHYSTPENRAANFSKISVGIAGAQGLAPLILGFCADHLGYGMAFMIAAMFSLVSWGIFTLGRVKHLGPVANAAEKQSRQGGTLTLLRDPRLRAVYLVSTLFILSWDIFLVMTPIHGSRLGLSASQIGMVMSSLSVGTFAVRFMGGLLARHYTPWQLLLGALVVSAAGTMAFGLVVAVPLLMASAVVIGLGQGLGSPMSTTAIYEVAPEGRASEAMGLRLSLGMAAQTVLPLVVGSIGALLAAGPIYIASGLMLLGGAIAERGQWRSGKKSSA